MEMIIFDHCIRPELKILSSYGKIIARENPYSGMILNSAWTKVNFDFPCGEIPAQGQYFAIASKFCSW